MTQRQAVVVALPGIVGFLRGLTWLNHSNPIERILYSAGMGLVLFVGAGVAYAVVEHVVGKLAGVKLESDHVTSRDVRMTASILLAVLIWIQGTYWVDRKVDSIARCVDDLATRPSDSHGFRTAEELVRWCASEYEVGSIPDLD